MKQGIEQLKTVLAEGGTEVRQVYPPLAVMADALVRDNTDPETARWLDGRRFTRWLAKNGLSDLHGLDEAIRANLRRWGQGGAVSLEAADELLTKQGFGSIAALPDELWMTRPGGGRGSPRPSEKREIVALRLHAEVPASELAERYGVSEGAVRRWVREAA